MLNDKSPGRNGITSEAYKLWISGETREILVSIIHKYWTDDTFNPEIFHEIKLRLLPKKVISQTLISREASLYLIYARK